MTRKKVIRQAIQRNFPTIGINDSLGKAVNAMADNNVSVLAVRIQEEIVGIVTVTDVMYGLSQKDGGLDTKIYTVMTKCETNVSKTTRNPCIQLDENEDALAAVKLMYEAGVNHLLISGFNGEIVGIVSSLDLVKLFSDNNTRS